MEVVLFTALVLHFIVIPIIGWCNIILFLLGFAYSYSYFDGSESRNGSRCWPWFRERVQLLVDAVGKRVFEYKVVYHNEGGKEKLISLYTQEAEGNVVFCASRHGLLPLSSLLHLSSHDFFKGTRLRIAIHKHSLSLPILREFLLWCGAIDPTPGNIRETISVNPLYIIIDGSRGMMHDWESVESDKRHRGILDLAYEKGAPVIPIRHDGQENVFHCYTHPYLDRVRTFFMDNTGYAFPSFFTAWSVPLTTHVFEPLFSSNKEKYPTSDAFVNAYFESVKRS